LRHCLVVASIVLLAACSDNRSAELFDKPAATTVPADAAPRSTQGLVVGKAPTAPNSKSFVTLTPADTKALPPPDTKPMMDQIQLSFVPALLIVRSGTPVVFRSSDEELHNININHARTRQQEFNIAIPPDGTYEHTFRTTGFYDVHCDIHPTMSAQIFVADTPYVVVADADGSFAFESVEPGAYTLSVYTGGTRRDQPIQVASGRNDVQITMN
jgi:plastocyanin